MLVLELPLPEPQIEPPFSEFLRERTNGHRKATSFEQDAEDLLMAALRATEGND